MWLAVRTFYPDADPKEFHLLDTITFIAIQRDEITAFGLCPEQDV